MGRNAAAAICSIYPPGSQRNVCINFQLNVLHLVIVTVEIDPTQPSEPHIRGPYGRAAVCHLLNVNKIILATPKHEKLHC